MNAATVYHGSNGAQTTHYYRLLCSAGKQGIIAMNLMRASKASSRAKKYRGGPSRGVTYRDLAYEKKEWCLAELTKALAAYGQLEYGWGLDLHQPVHQHVLYVTLPEGQCSFHTRERGKGPDSLMPWDGEHKSTERILAFCEAVMSESERAQGTLALVGA